MADVAKKAGVSKSTVSQYINKRYEYMADSTKIRIEEAINELGYIPNFVAKSLKQKKSSSIGVIVANILHTFSTEIIRVIEDVCEERNFHMFICNADDDPKKEREYIETLMAKQVDGLIVFPTSTNFKLYEELKKSGIPIVFVDRKTEKLIYPTVLLNNYQTADIAVSKLTEAGHKKIGVVSPSLANQLTPRVERIEGFKEALQKRGIEPNEDWIIAADREEMIPKLEKVWRGNEKPDAFFSTNDISLIELLKFLNKNNLRIPEDVSVITVDDSDYLEIASTPISAIKQPAFDIGRRAANTLFELIDQSEFMDEYEIERFPPKFIKRKSIKERRD